MIGQIRFMECTSEGHNEELSGPEQLICPQPGLLAERQRERSDSPMSLPAQTSVMRFYYPDLRAHRLPLSRQHEQ